MAGVGPRTSRKEYSATAKIAQHCSNPTANIAQTAQADLVIGAPPRAPPNEGSLHVSHPFADRLHLEHPKTKDDTVGDGEGSARIGAAAAGFFSGTLAAGFLFTTFPPAPTLPTPNKSCSIFSTSAIASVSAAGVGTFPPVPVAVFVALTAGSVVVFGALAPTPLFGFVAIGAGSANRGLKTKAVGDKAGSTEELLAFALPVSTDDGRCAGSAGLEVSMGVSSFSFLQRTFNSAWSLFCLPFGPSPEQQRRPMLARQR